MTDDHGTLDARLRAHYSRVRGIPLTQKLNAATPQHLIRRRSLGSSLLTVGALSASLAATMALSGGIPMHSMPGSGRVALTGGVNAVPSAAVSQSVPGSQLPPSVCGDTTIPAGAGAGARTAGKPAPSGPASACPTPELTAPAPATTPATTPAATPAATPAPTSTTGAINPGPAGDFFWKGLNWQRRAGGGNPGITGQWSSANVIGPDSNGYLTFRWSNPYGAELDSTRSGFGYGTYTIVVATRLDVMDHGLVWGGLFTYDGSGTGNANSTITQNEIEVDQTSAWGNGTPVLLDHTYHTNVGGTDTGVGVHTTMPADIVQTHQMIWAPGSITWNSYVGTGTGGALINQTVQTADVPTPANEKLMMNLWPFSTTPAPFDVTVRDFSFVPQ